MRSTILLFILVSLAYLTQLGSYGLLEPDEGRYAEIAREMVEPGGDWIVPHLNGIPHFQKPPLFYWLTAISFRFFGLNEFAARLPVALSALGALLLATSIARKLYGMGEARLTLMILASSALFAALGRIVTPDMTMTFWITAAVACLVRSNDRIFWGWLFFVCAGLGFLTKGPVAFLVPFSAALAYRNSVKIPWLWGLPIALLIGLSWFLVLSARIPGLADYFLHHELLDRFGSATHGRSRPFWFFVPVTFAGFFPWTFFAIAKLPGAWRKRASIPPLYIGWVAIPFVVLSLSGSKLPTYVLPLFPGLAIGLSSILSRQIQRSTILIGVGVLTMAFLALLPSRMNAWNDLLERQASVRPLAVRIRQERENLVGEYRVIACEIRANGLEFYLRQTVEITRGDADIAVSPDGTEFNWGKTKLHRKPQDVAKLEPAPGVPIFVVTRLHRFQQDFAPRGWEKLQVCGDFVLLRR